MICHPSLHTFLLFSTVTQANLVYWLLCSKIYELTLGFSEINVYCRTEQGVIAAGASKTQIPKYFQGKDFNDGVTFELNLGGQIRILYAENVGKGLQKDHLDQVQI